MTIDTAPETVHRLIARDGAVRAAGKKPPWNATRRIVEYATEHRLLTDPTVGRWLRTVAIDADIWVSHRLLQIVQTLVRAEAEDEAHALYHCVLGLDESSWWARVAPTLVRDGMLVQAGIESILGVPGLLANWPETWGRTACELLARITLEHQRRAWPSQQRLATAFAEAVGQSFDSDRAFAVDYDDSPSLWFFDRHRPHDTRALIATAVGQGLREAAQLADGAAFRRLAEQLVGHRFAIGIGLVLTALLDSLQGKTPRPEWLAGEATWFLALEGVQEHMSIGDLRRLVRRALGRPDAATTTALAEAIRRSPISDTARIHELADMVDWGVLTAEEMAAVAELAAEGELYPPVDPREHSAFTSSEWVPENRDAASNWPHPDDAEAIRLLAQITPEPAPDDLLEKLEEDTRRRLEALRAVLSRQECDSAEWCGEILGWCHRGLSDLRTFERRRREGQGTRGELSAAEWEEILDANAPWWRERVEAALRKLSEPPPRAHHDNESGGLAWGSADPLYQSLCYLDEALAVDGSGPFAALRDRLDAAVDTAWPNWPPFTRATALSILRPWYWRRLPKVRSRLSDLAGGETDPLVAQYAVERILNIGGPEMAVNLERFLGRAESIPGFGRTLDHVGRFLGSAALAKVSRATANPEITSLAELFQRLQVSPPTHATTRESLVHGVLWGAQDFMEDVEERTQPLASAWLSIVNWAIAHWPPFGDPAKDEERFPLLPITSVLELAWSPPVWHNLIAGLSEMILRLVREGSLGDYYDLHHELRELIGRKTVPPATKSWVEYGGIPDALAVALCSASADRVLAWSRADKTTRDVAWVSALSGHETCDLIRAAFDAAEDRDYLRRELPSIIDRLAEAGYMGTATELRLYLRRN